MGFYHETEKKLSNEFGDQLCDCCERNIVEHKEHELCSECYNEIQETAKVIGYRKGE